MGGGGGGREGRLGGGFRGSVGGGSQVGQFRVLGGGGAQAPVTSPCPPSGVRARATVRARVRARVRVRVMGRVRCRVRSRLRVGVGVRVKVGFKYSVGVLHRLAGRDATLARGMKKKFRAPSAPPYVWPVAIDPW